DCTNALDEIAAFGIRTHWFLHLFSPRDAKAGPVLSSSCLRSCRARHAAAAQRQGRLDRESLKRDREIGAVIHGMVRIVASPCSIVVQAVAEAENARLIPA